MSTIRLEPLAVNHLDAVAELVDDPAVQRFTRVPVPPPPDFARTWLDATRRTEPAGAARHSP